MTKRLSLEELFREIVELILRDFSDIVVDVQLRFTSSGSIERLRIFLKDESFVDVWLSTSGKYSYHWEHRHISGLIYRHNNARIVDGRRLKLFRSTSMMVAKIT